VIRKLGLIALALMGLFQACAGPKTCRESGDLRWTHESFNGNRYCSQKKRKDGTYVNHGEFIQKNKEGSVVLKGSFNMGKMDGTWTFFNEKGEAIQERYFDKGLEKGGGGMRR